MKDFFAFRTMITPSLVQIIFVIGLIVILVLGLVDIVQGFNTMNYKEVAGGVLMILLGPIALRFYLEIIVVLFMINDSMRGVQSTLQNQTNQPMQPVQSIQPTKTKVIVEDESPKL